MTEASQDTALFASKDSEYHRRLSETTHNPLMILLLDSVHDMMGAVRTIVAAESGVYERVMPTHLRILESVMAHDGAGAREAMREHLEIARVIQIEVTEKRLRSSPGLKRAIVVS